MSATARPSPGELAPTDLSRIAGEVYGGSLYTSPALWERSVRMAHRVRVLPHHIAGASK
jgi:hypothetical protein